MERKIQAADGVAADADKRRMAEAEIASIAAENIPTLREASEKQESECLLDIEIGQRCERQDRAYRDDQSEYAKRFPGLMLCARHRRSPKSPLGRTTKTSRSNE